jgi:hypothetical protein
MQSVACSHPPGTVIVPTSELQRYTPFMLSMLRLQVPVGTKLTIASSVGVAQNINTCISEAAGAWVWILGDDHEFPAHALLALLERGVDIVAPLTLRRIPPLQPVMFRDYNPATRTWPQLTWADLPPQPDALCEVGAVGGAGLLIRMAALETLPKPIFEIGQTRSDTLSEDLWFCKKARDAGYKVYVDCGVTLGHTTIVTHTPVYRDGRWMVASDLGGGTVLHLDPAL